MSFACVKKQKIKRLCWSYIFKVEFLFLFLFNYLGIWENGFWNKLQFTLAYSWIMALNLSSPCEDYVVTECITATEHHSRGLIPEPNTEVSQPLTRYALLPKHVSSENGIIWFRPPCDAILFFSAFAICIIIIIRTSMH